MKKIGLLLGVLILISACSSKARENLGFEKQIPDEKMITVNQPLTLPPDFDTTPVSENNSSDFNS